MALVLATAPAADPLTLDELKLHLRIDHTDEDALLDGILKTAIADVETLTLCKLVTQTWDYYMDYFPVVDVIRLPYPPLASVTGVYYTPENGSEQTYSASNYIVDTKGKPGGIVLKRTSSFPADELEPVNGVRIRFVCGVAPHAVDIRAKQAIKLLAGHYYENREAVQMGQGLTPAVLPMAVTSLCNQLRFEIKRF